MKKFIIAVAAGLIPLLSFSQLALSGRISGISTGEPLPGASVSVTGTYYSTSADVQGRYYFKNLKPGKYVLKVTYLGYKTNYLPVDLTVPEQVDIQLEESPFLQEEVVVTSTRVGEKTPITYQNIGRQDIQKINMGQDLPFLLENSVSAVSASDAGNGIGYSSLRIRGTDLTRINVTINGIPLNDPESHAVYWVDLPDFASSTDNIQVQRGVGTSTNGSAAFGASINLQSNKLNPDPYAEINSSYGSFRTFKNTLAFGTGFLNKHFTIDGRASKISSAGYIDRASTDLSSLFLTGAYSVSKSILRFNLFTGNEKTYQAWDGIPSDILANNRTYNGMGYYTDLYGKEHYYDNETDNYRQTHLQAFYSHELNQRLVLNAALHYTKGYGYYEQYRDNDKLGNYGIAPVKISGNSIEIDGVTIPFPDGFIKTSDLVRRKYLDNDFYGLTWSLNYRNKKIQTTLGGSANYYDGSHFGQIIWSQFASNSIMNHEWYRGKGQKSDFNVYAKTTYQAWNRTSIFLDLQIRSVQHTISGSDDVLRNITQEHRFAFFNPKAGVYFQLNNANAVYASVAIANREPSRDNFVDADPSKPAPVSETLVDLEAGHIYKSSKFTLTGNVYYMGYHNQLALTGAINDVGSPVMVNVPGSYRIGLEVVAQLNVTPRLSWNCNFTISRNKILNFSEYIDNWNDWSQISINHKNPDLSFSPSVIAGSEVSYKPFKRFSADLMSKFVGRQYIDNTQDLSRSLHPYFVNSLLLQYNLLPKTVNGIMLTLAINNLLNEKYESNAWVYRYYEGNDYKSLDGYFPQAGLNFMAGITVKI